MAEAFLLMLLTGLLWTVVAVLFGRVPPGREEIRAFFALNGAVFTAVAFAARAPQAAPPAEVLRLAALVVVPGSAMEAVSAPLLKLAMDRGGQGVAWSIAQSSVVIPFAGSVLFLGAKLAAFHVAGLALMLASLALFAREKGGCAGNDAVFFRLVFAAFLFSGLGSFVRLVPGHAGFSPETLTWRLPLQALPGTAFWACLAARRWRPGPVWRHSLFAGSASALGALFFYAAADAADKVALTSLVMPVAVGVCIFLFTLWCRIVRHERLSRGGRLAVALDVAGIALLSLQ